MTKTRSAWTAVTYVVSSILIWPLIAVAGFAVLEGGGDACGTSTRGSVAARTGEYLLMDAVHTTGAGLMLVVGFAVLSVLWLRGRALNQVALVLLSCGVLVAMLAFVALGYVAIAADPAPAC